MDDAIFLYLKSRFEYATNFGDFLFVTLPMEAQVERSLDVLIRAGGRFSAGIWRNHDRRRSAFAAKACRVILLINGDAIGPGDSRSNRQQYITA